MKQKETLLNTLSDAEDIGDDHIVSSTDTPLRADAFEMDDALKIEQVMSKQIDSIKAEDQIKEAAELLAKGRYHALPVLEDGKLAGIVTSTDIIKYLLEQY